MLFVIVVVLYYYKAPGTLFFVDFMRSYGELIQQFLCGIELCS